METQFQLFKYGNVSKTVFANPDTKEIYPAHRTGINNGYNAVCVKDDEFYIKYGHKLRTTQCRRNYKMFFYSEKAMNSAGFILVRRSQKPLF